MLKKLKHKSERIYIAWCGTFMITQKEDFQNTK
jgi:hypothetical protein